MAIGERIRYFRSKKGMTLKYLGTLVGFPERSADVRMAQYESGARTPKADLTAALAHVLDVSPQALTVPDIDSYIGLMHTLFTLEDNYGLKINEISGEVCLTVDVFRGTEAVELSRMLHAWRQAAVMFKAGEITQEEYDRWRRYYPQYDTTQHWAKIPSKELSDAMVDALKDKRK